MAPNLYYSVIVDGQWQLLLQHMAQHTRKVCFGCCNWQHFWRNNFFIGSRVESTNLNSTRLFLCMSISLARSLHLSPSFRSISFDFVWFCQLQTHFGVVFKIRLIILKTIITFITITFIVYIKFLKVDLAAHSGQEKLGTWGGRERGLHGQILWLFQIDSNTTKYSYLLGIYT